MKTTRIVTALVACGALGIAPAATQASSAAAPTWTQQTPLVSATHRQGASMAYDADTGTAMLFGGGANRRTAFNGTWTWDGTAWTKQPSAVSPSNRYNAAMAYDAAAGNVVLFGGFHRGSTVGDTWTWG